MLGIGEIIYFCLLFVALFISIARRKFLPWYFIYFRILLSFSILFDLGGFILKFYHYPRYWVYHLYRPLDYIFFACLFFFEIKTEAEKKIIKYSCFLFVLVCIIYSIKNNFSGPTSLTSTISNAFAVIICVLYFRDILRSDERIVLIKEPMFWIATGSMFFCLATFFSMGFLKYLRQNNNPLANKYFLINYAMNYTLYLTYIIGVLCSKTHPKSTL